MLSCYLNSLALAVENGCSSIAFPLIGAGVYQYPKSQVLKFAIQTITELLFDNELTVILHFNLYFIFIIERK